jgi:hypothetical protein
MELSSTRFRRPPSFNLNDRFQIACAAWSTHCATMSAFQRVPPLSRFGNDGHRHQTDHRRHDLVPKPCDIG